nr:immunoglobulin light chain junction region [Macaca mulatta]MOV86134.1 immunoglobulin light chain junction region [Macaca mulatta]MPN96323.1 immunoglobulin light chain junction region [Macaca mulatta]MPN98427.1 immunoglobulin light chain junction region [Macaca mulatta]
CQHYNSLPRTF